MVSWPGLTQSLARIFAFTRCPACGQPGLDRQTGLCASCLNQLESQIHATCKSCGKPVPEGRMYCQDCNLSPNPWDETHCLGPYKGLLRDMILDCKFSGRLHLARTLGILAAKRLSPDPEF